MTPALSDKALAAAERIAKRNNIPLKTVIDAYIRDHRRLRRGALPGVELPLEGGTCAALRGAPPWPGLSRAFIQGDPTQRGRGCLSALPDLPAVLSCRNLYCHVGGDRGF